MRKKPNMPQRMARCAAVSIGDPEAYRGAWLEKIPGYRRLHLEIGCGRGRFTVETALSMPETLLVAVEKVPEALIMGMERAVSEGIPNVRFISADAMGLPLFFGAGEVGRIYINFCDPWPNNGHKKRRLTHENYLKMYESILKSGGEIHFKTDNIPLFEFTLGEFTRQGFALADVTRDLHRDGPAGIMTDYEMKFVAQGVSICRCVAKISTSENT